ncbi:MAG TPA: hypothetical protein PLG27_08780 [Candidatus Latescibacteria bacterium]|jgi:hypothetical protein|nr:hypothetical protein [Candidatus Latescibacterota bacterium]HQE61082.1 hypothetical protein [Candidatus Latescibacterota bacterium]
MDATAVFFSQIAVFFIQWAVDLFRGRKAMKKLLLLLALVGAAVALVVWYRQTSASLDMVPEDAEDIELA